MPRVKKLDLGMAALDELFMNDKERAENKLPKIFDIPLSEIDDFPGHPYRVLDDEDMQNLMESIKDRGVITPAMVRKKDDGRYEMISGHRRKHASERLGLETLRCEVVEVSRDEAIILMVDSNSQRSEIAPTDKGKAYKMKLEAIKRQQGERTDLTSVPSGQKLNGKTSREILAENSEDSNTQIQRYIRLTNLVPELQDFVDKGKMKMRPAVELSYLDEETQRDIVDRIDETDVFPSHAQAISIRRAYEAGKIDYDKVRDIMAEEKPNQQERIVLRGDRVRKFIPKSIPLNKTEEYVCKALEHYASFLRKRAKSGTLTLFFLLDLSSLGVNLELSFSILIVSIASIISSSSFISAVLANSPIGNFAPSIISSPSSISKTSISAISGLLCKFFAIGI